MVAKRHYYFVDGKRVSRAMFEKVWNSEHFYGNAPPPKEFSRWQGRHEYSIRSKP